MPSLTNTGPSRPIHPWPGPLKVELPSGDVVTLTLFRDRKCNALQLLVENPRLAAYADDELSEPCLSLVNAEDRRALNLLVVQAAENYTGKQMFREGSDENGLYIDMGVGFELSICFRPGRMRANSDWVQVRTNCPF
jgi:hypothetical protein